MSPKELLVSFLILPRISLENSGEKSFGETNTVIVTFSMADSSPKTWVEQNTLALAIVNMTRLWNKAVEHEAQIMMIIGRKGIIVSLALWDHRRR